MARGRIVLILTFICSVTILLSHCGQVIPPADNYKGQADKGYRTFIKNCATCHNMRSDENAPTIFDLANSIPKRPDGWVVNYTLNNEKVFNDGDTIAQRLRRQYKDRMLVFEDELTENDVKDIIAHLTRGPQP